MPLYLHIPKSQNGPTMVREVKDLAEASRIYSDEREKRGEGGSTFGSGRIDSKTGLEPVKDIGRISYNGKVWAPKEWTPGDIPLYAPYA